MLLLPPLWSRFAGPGRQVLLTAYNTPASARPSIAPAHACLDLPQISSGVAILGALGGGYLHWGHFEMMRLTLIRSLSSRTTFSRWLVVPPHKPVTRKGLGQRMGGGKGAVDHYVTPVKADQLVLEVGGHCEFAEVQPVLIQLAKKLPFRAQAVSRESLAEARLQQEQRALNDQNPWSFTRLATRNMLGCRKWLSPYDIQTKGRYAGKRHLPNRA
ncbi:hypothetical protein FKM82_017650 [Ascaphus truei]